MGFYMRLTKCFHSFRPDTIQKTDKAEEGICRNQLGQAMTEYVFLVVVVGLVCIPVFKWLPDAIRGYVRPFYYVVSRPIP